MVVRNVSQDRSKNDITQDDEIRYWAKHLGATREELQTVLHKVGNSAAAVRKQLALFSSTKVEEAKNNSKEA